jgi:hypothetical protein
LLANRQLAQLLAPPLGHQSQQVRQGQRLSQQARRLSQQGQHKRLTQPKQYTLLQLNSELSSFCSPLNVEPNLKRGGKQIHLSNNHAVMKQLKEILKAYPYY